MTKRSTSQSKNGKTRPTKKQHETLNFIHHFISEHGYSPSYREIMNGCNYNSVATVALHVKNLIARGHVVKRDNSARSLEVVGGVNEKQTFGGHKHELVQAVESRLEAVEKELSEELLNEAYVLVGALKILGHEDIARAFAGRINQL